MFSNLNCIDRTSLTTCLSWRARRCRTRCGSGWPPPSPSRSSSSGARTRGPPSGAWPTPSGPGSSSRRSTGACPHPSSWSSRTISTLTSRFALESGLVSCSYIQIVSFWELHVKHFETFNLDYLQQVDSWNFDMFTFSRAAKGSPLKYLSKFVAISSRFLDF